MPAFFSWPSALKRVQTIRINLLLLIVAIMLPTVAMWAWYINSEADEQRQAAYAQVRLVVDDIATAVQQELAAHALFLQLIGQEYLHQTGNTARTFNPDQFLRLHPAVVEMGVRNAAGNSIYSSRAPAQTSADLLMAPWAESARLSDTPSVSGALWDAHSGRWVTVLTQPVYSATGKRTGFSYLSIDLLKLNQRMLTNLNKQWVVPIIDRDDRFLMRSIDPQEWIGKPLPKPTADLIRGKVHEVFTAPDVHGEVRIYSLATLPTFGWRVAAGIPEAQALGGVDTKRNTSILLGLGTLISLMGLAWWRAGSIADPIIALVQGIEKMQDNSQHRITLRGFVELEQVAAKLNAFVDLIEQQHQERMALAQHYATMRMQAREVILLFDEHGRILDANLAALKAYGYSEQELYALSARDLRAASAKSATDTDWNAAVCHQGALFETVHQRKDGSTFDVEVNSSSIDIEGRVYLQSFVRDISERKLAELALIRRTHALEALSACNRARVSEDTLEGLMAAVCRAIVNKAGYRMAWVGSAQHDSEQSIKVLAHAGVDHGYLDQLNLTWADTSRGRGPGGTAIRENKTVVVQNLDATPHFAPWRSMAIEHGFASVTALPLVVHGVPWGVLGVYASDANAFGADEMQLLEELSVDLAYGIAKIQEASVRQGLERTLAASEDRFRLLIEQSPAGIFVMRHGIFVYANPRMEEIIGFDADELVGVHSQQLILPEDWHFITEAMERLTMHASTGNFSVRARRKDGVVIELGLQDVLADFEGQPAIIGMAQDISERSRTQAEIERYIARLEHTTEATLQSVALMVEQRDPYTAGHERRVGELAAAIGTEMGLSEHVVKGLRLTGIVHDIGKIAVPAELLAKPTRLSEVEMALIRVHPQAGYDVLKNVEFPWPLAEVILQHDERLDGSGYPRGLQGDAILLEARIMMVADVVESMSSHRPYRPGLGIDAALGEIEKHRGTFYDPAVVDACIRLYREKAYVLAA